jgi:ribosomal protein S18 acetylase RimI-like enzyme
MTGETLQDDGWILREAIAADIDELMRWFPKFDDVRVWGGPSFRFPFTRETFFKDIYWGKMASLCLCDPANRVVAFGQLYERDGRIHLARLVVIPDMRGHGVGRRLIEMLMTAGQARFPGNEYSLFVFRDNQPAYECYKSLGFGITDYPDDMPHADVCYYLTRRAGAEES